jgi:hypothetical protein
MLLQQQSYLADASASPALPAALNWRACSHPTNGAFEPHYLMKPKPKSRLIPTYRASGRRWRDHALPTIERWLALGLVVVSRSKKGRITCAQFKSDGGENTLVAHAHMGQHYAYEQHLPSGHYAWRHRDLHQRQEVEAHFGEKLDTREAVDLYLRGIFRAVPLSCMAAKNVSRETSKVVSITSARRPAAGEQREERRAA